MRKEKYNSYIFLFLFLSFSLSLTGQTVSKFYNGTVVDSEDKQILEGVVCEALDRNKQIVSYDISGVNGAFSLNFDERIQLIVFRLLGYEKKEIEIKEIHESGKIQIELIKNNFTLKEIVVKAPPIQKSNDTIRYNVSSFRGQEDRYVTDLLKKLPGIKVNDNGTIIYQGEPISNFYIEGRDLLGGQYSQATNNLTIDAVSQVEVLENHQHVKAKKGVEFSEKAAINLKLKKGYAVKPFGEIQMGIGGLPAIYNEKLFLIHLSGKVQTLANFKINNTGNNIMNEMEDKFDVSNLLSYEPLPENLLIPPSPQTLPLAINRYLFNKTGLGSINNLLALSENIEIRSNFSYGYDRLKQDFFSRQNYAIGKDNLQINEQNEIADKIDNYRFSLIVENNSASKYIKNESILLGKREKVNSGIDSDTRRLETYNENSPSYMQNYFQALFKYSGDKTVKINSFTRYSSNNELLNVEQAGGDDPNDWEETFAGKYLTSKNHVGIAGNLLGQRLELGADITYKQRNLDKLLSPLKIEAFDGLIHNTENETELFQAGVSSDYQIKSGHKIVTTIQIPFTYSIYKAKNSMETSFTDGRWLFMPSISNNYKINHRWELYTRLGHDFRYADDKSLLNNPFFRNYRTIYIPSETLINSKNYNASMRVKYKDLVEMLFFNFYILYRISDFNYMNKSDNSPYLSYRSTERKDNTGYQFLISTDLSKTFVPIKLVLTLNPSYTQMKSQFIQQNILISNTSHVASLNLKSELKVLKKATMVHQMDNQIVWNDNNLTDRKAQKSMKQKLLVYYFPNKNIDISTAFDYTLLERNENAYDSYFFMDIAANYQYKKMEFSATLSNILNKTAYSVLSLSTVNSNYQMLPLRGREVLFTAKMNF